MGAGHGHGHAGGRHRWRLAVSFGLVAAFFGVELAVGLVSGSLALISDAGHMAADVVALGAALVATKIATRPDGTGRRTYGSYRAEVLASGFTVLIMLGVAVYVVVEAAGRIGADVEVATGPLLVVGGPRFDETMAAELGVDRVFTRGTTPGEVASFIVHRMTTASPHDRTDS